MKKVKIICVVGATASGKTALSVELAKRLGGEIICADSMQVYKDMPIATAAVTQEEKQGVKHYLTEFLEPSEPFSVADFVKLAKPVAFDINSREKIPIIAGGTGLFVDSFVKNIEFADVMPDYALREELKSKTNEELYDMLLQRDFDAANSIHKNNRKRVIRALELCCAGTTKTQQNVNSVMNDSPFDAMYIEICYRNRQILYDRINKRVDFMLERGLVNEAENQLKKGGATSRQAIGHKELKPYFDGEISYDEAVENIKRATRRYAKRQLTWFRRNANAKRFYADEMSFEELCDVSYAAAHAFIEGG